MPDFHILVWLLATEATSMGIFSCSGPQAFSGMQAEYEWKVDQLQQHIGQQQQESSQLKLELQTAHKVSPACDESK